MSNPFLSLALGGLQGAAANKSEKERLEERQRKHAREDLEEKVFLAQLAQNPDFDISSIAPFVAAATGSAGGGGAPAGAPAAPPMPPPVRRTPTTIADAGALDLPPPPSIIPRTPPGVGGGPDVGAGPAVPPVKAPPAPGGPSTPFLDQALDLGSVDIGGQKFGIKTKAGGKKARNRMAYETLHEADAEAYPHYIEDADYAGEMADYAKGVRQGRIESMKEKGRGRTGATAQAARVRVQLAEDMAYDLFEQGHSLEEVQAAVARDPQARGGLSPARGRMIQRDAAKAAPDLEQSRGRVRTQLGIPPRPMSEGTPVSDDVREAVIDALAHGHTGEEVIAAIKDPTVAHTVRRWLSRKGQAKRNAAPVPTP